MPENNALLQKDGHKTLSGVRWWICGLLFFATTINYIDRQVIGVLKPMLEKTFNWNQIDYSNIVVAFQAAYALGLLIFGRIIDRIGVRAGFAAAVFFWSLAAIAHGFVSWILPNPSPESASEIKILGNVFTMSVFAFCLARIGLGLSEAGNFPAAIRTVSEWFPKKERALATGIFNAGSNVGALITPILAPWLAIKYGWPAAFYFTGALGFIWLIGWLLFYQNPDSHPLLRKSELDYIRSDPQDSPKKIPWLSLLKYKQTWAFVVAKFMTDPIWWLYLFWVPDFLNKRHGLDLKNFGPPLVVIYLMTDGGSIAGGWLSSWLIKKGWTINKSRKTAMLVCALCVVPIMVASQVSNLWLAVLLIGLAASAHQGWSANIFTTVSDTVPKQAVSSVTGIGGMAGAIGGMFIAKLVGYILQVTNNSYFIPFLIASFAYLAALLIIHLINPKLEPMKIE